MRRIRPPFLPDRGSVGWTPYAWLIYLASFYITPVSLTRAGAADWWTWPVTIAATIIFLVTFFRAYWVRGVKLIPIAATHTLLGIALAPVNPGSSVFFVYAASFAAQLDRPRDALRSMLVIALFGAATAPFTPAPLFFVAIAVGITFVVGSVNLHYAQQGRAQQKLRLAHEEIEQLAAIAERERIARDLHDVLGHTLSLIVLKAELAVKLSGIDSERAVREMREVEQVARATLQDVRIAIRGYRTTLVEEADRARSMLKAARVDARLEIADTPLAQPVEEALALALREAVTNVVRHAGATRCTIHTRPADDHIVLDVQDDGRGIAAAPGLGLRGMRERIESLGGTVTLRAERGTRLSVTLPLHSTPAAPAGSTANRPVTV